MKNNDEYNLNLYTLCFFIVNGTRQSAVEATILKDDKPLGAKDVEAIVHDDHVLFKIKKPEHVLTGKYQIKLKNDQGEDIKDVFINMQGNVLFKTKMIFLKINVRSYEGEKNKHPLNRNMY